MEPCFFKTIYLDSIGKLLAFGWPDKRRINFILEHSAMRKSELYSQEQSISGRCVYLPTDVVPDAVPSVGVRSVQTSVRQSQPVRDWLHLTWTMQ